jgi:hypothetical protein
MNKLQQVATTTTTVTEQVTLTPALRRKLLVELRAYAGLRTQLKTIEYAMDKVKSKVEGVLGDVGESNLSVDGFKTALICAKGSSKLDPMKLVALGVSTSIIEKATVQGPPKAPYIKITCPGGKDDQ